MDDPKINIYRGQDSDIDYETIVAEMALNDTEVSISSQDLPPNTIWHYVARQTSPCGLESEDSPICAVIIDSAGNMLGQSPNKPANVMIEQLAGGKFRLRWRYFRQSQEVQPIGFKIYMDSGAGFDFDDPCATVAYTGAIEHSWDSSALVNGQVYKFTIRSYARLGQSGNSNIVSAAADSIGPQAASGLSISVVEV